MNAGRLIAASAAALVAAGIAAAAVVLPVADWPGLTAQVSSSASDVQIAQAAAPPPLEPPQQAPATQPKQQQAPQAAPLAPAQAPAAPAPQPAVVRQNDAEVVLTLVRSTMVALDQANLSGNYTVLRDISAPGFRDKNSAADLARIFAPIREAKIDLSGAVMLDPHISKATLNEQKMLYVAGAFETKPLAVTFELLFEPVVGRWRIFGISVTPIGQTSDAPAPREKAPKAAAKSPSPNTKRPPAPKAIVPNSAAPGAANPK